jgi:hypothetical protein
MEFGGYEAASTMSGPFLGILIGVPISLAVWAVAAALALMAF